MSNRRNILLLALICFPFAAEVAQLTWYSGRWFAGKGGVGLDYSLPDEEDLNISGKDLLHTRVSKSLDFDEGDLIAISSTGEGAKWVMNLYHLKYNTGNRRQLKDMFDHSPEVCLGSSGASLLETYRVKTCELGGRKHLIRHLLFLDPTTRKPIHVFKFIWLAPHKAFQAEGDELDFRSIRLRAAMARYWPGEAHQFLASISLPEGEQEAWNIFRTLVTARCKVVER